VGLLFYLGLVGMLTSILGAAQVIFGFDIAHAWEVGADGRLFEDAAHPVLDSLQQAGLRARQLRRLVAAPLLMLLEDRVYGLLVHRWRIGHRGRRQRHCHVGGQFRRGDGRRCGPRRRCGL
jgi:hypothetical protein